MQAPRKSEPRNPTALNASRMDKVPSNPRRTQRRMPYMRYARLILPTVLALLVIALVVLLSGCGGGGGY